MAKIEPGLNRLLFYIREHLGVDMRDREEEIRGKLIQILEQRDNHYYLIGYEDGFRDGKNPSE